MSVVTPTMRVCAALLESVAHRGGDAVTPYDAPNGNVPQIPLCDYLSRWARYTETDDAEVLCAVVYIDRVCTRTGLVLTRRNVHRVILASILTATKWREDHPFKMTHYAKVGGVRPAELHSLERRWIDDLDWRIFVDASVKDRYDAKFQRHPAWNTDVSRVLEQPQQQQRACAALRG